jgi:polar amino acid transport system substrate-binding protein
VRHINRGSLGPLRLAAQGLALLTLLIGVLSGCGGGTASAPTSVFDQVKKRGVIAVGVRTDDPPHSYINDQGQLVGFDIDIADAIARHWNVDLNLIKADELTRISYLQNGKIDIAVASISKTRKRAQTVDFSQTYFWSKQSFLVRKGAISKLDDLVGKRVGADRGSSASGNWQTWLKAHDKPANADIVLFGDKHLAADSVKQGVIAGWAEDYEILASYAKYDPSLKVLDDPGGIGLKLDGIAVRKNDSAFLLAVNLALQDIAASGQYDSIYQRWFGPDSATPVPRLASIEVWPNG